MPLSVALNRADGAAELSPSGPYRGLKQFGLVLLCAAWILLGLFGHDPWKADDATAFGIAYDMLKQGDWVVPHLAGMPVPDHPPASVCACRRHRLGAARGAAVARRRARRGRAVHRPRRCGCSGSPGANSMAGRFGWLPVLIFIGCVGLWDRGHLLSPEIGLLLADALALYALALALRRPVIGGAWLGLALGMAFLCRGPVAAGDHRPDRRGAAAVRAVAHPPLRAVPVGGAGRRAAAACRVAPGALPTLASAVCTVGGRPESRPILRPDREIADLGATLLSQEPALVRVAGATAGAVDPVGAQPRLQRQPRDVRCANCRARCS